MSSHLMSYLDSFNEECNMIDSVSTIEHSPDLYQSNPPVPATTDLYQLWIPTAFSTFFSLIYRVWTSDCSLLLLGNLEQHSSATNILYAILPLVIIKYVTTCCAILLSVLFLSTILTSLLPVILLIIFFPLFIVLIIQNILLPCIAKSSNDLHILMISTCSTIAKMILTGMGRDLLSHMPPLSCIDRAMRSLDGTHHTSTTHLRIQLAADLFGVLEYCRELFKSFPLTSHDSLLAALDSEEHHEALILDAHSVSLRTLLAYSRMSTTALNECREILYGHMIECVNKDGTALLASLIKSFISLLALLMYIRRRVSVSRQRSIFPPQRDTHNRFPTYLISDIQDLQRAVMNSRLETEVILCQLFHLEVLLSAAARGGDLATAIAAARTLQSSFIADRKSNSYCQLAAAIEKFLNPLVVEESKCCLKKDSSPIQAMIEPCLSSSEASDSSKTTEFCSSTTTVYEFGDDIPPAKIMALNESKSASIVEIYDGTVINVHNSYECLNDKNRAICGPSVGESLLKELQNELRLRRLLFEERIIRKDSDPVSMAQENEDGHIEEEKKKYQEESTRKRLELAATLMGAIQIQQLNI